MINLKLINLRGDMFATVLSFAAQTLIKLASSLILTRILRPEAYGVITILTSIAFIVSMLSDIGIWVSIIRDKNGETASYLNTAWTLRIGRALLNSALVFVCAPLIADLYNVPELTGLMRVFALWFLIDGVESTSFAVAVRRKNSRVIMYSELLSTAVGTVVTVAYCYFSRDFWGMVYGTLISRLVYVLMSHQFYRELRPKLQFNWEAAREMSKYTRFVMPSSILTLILSQFDKAAFLRLFDLKLLGVYGLAANVASPIEGLIGRASQLVLYPRCAHNFRTAPGTFSVRYYTENVKLFATVLALPAMIGGGAHMIMGILYDTRYAQAAPVLQAFMLRAALMSLSSPAEEMLVATGESRLILIGNIYRALWMVGASILGYYLFGFMGFVYGTALSGLPPLVYYFWLQKKKGMLIAKYELYRVGFSVGVGILSYFVSTPMMALWTMIRGGH